MKASQPEGVSIHAGFPNPATDSSLRSLDLNQLLIKHGASTYFFRVRGEHWQEAGVFDGDLAIVDRALDPRANDTVVWWNNDADEFSISTYKKVPKDATVWGVITATIHQFRKPDPQQTSAGGTSRGSPGRFSVALRDRKSFGADEATGPAARGSHGQ